MFTALFARFGFGRKAVVVDDRFEARMNTIGRRNARALPAAGQSAFRFQH